MRDLKNFIKGFVPIFVLLGIVWAVEVVNFATGHSLSRFGIRPRDLEGLIGVPLAPFLHVSLVHAVSNSGPLLVLGALVIVTAKRRFWPMTVAVILIGGLLTWAVGRGGNDIHLGASGLIFGYFGWLVARGLLERGIASVLAAIVVVLFYGGMFIGLLPHGPFISFESHIAGFVAGAGFAWIRRARAKSA